MADHSKIEWTEASWNPVTGCTEVSPGCDHCYAKTFAERWRGTPGHHFERGFDVTLRPERLDQPLRWTRPRRIFVNSMSDLFHDDVPDEYIARVVATIARAPQHTFQVLTKRHGRMRSLLGGLDGSPHRLLDATTDESTALAIYEADWPLPNLWLGVSVENQQWADIRIPVLLDTPAAVRWLSCEPLLGLVDLSKWIGEADDSAAASRGRGLPGSALGGVGDRPTGAGVEAGGEALGPLDGSDKTDPLHPAPRGKFDRQVPPGPGDVRQRSVARDGASAGLDSFPWADPGRAHGEPPERNLVRQPPAESGTGDVFGATDARAPRSSPGAGQPVRGPQRHGEADSGRGGGDPSTPGGRGVLAESRERVRGRFPDHIENRARRSSISWIVVGGESGPGARPMHPDWARLLRDQCIAGGVPFFLKQHGQYAPVADQPVDGDLWLAPDGAAANWKPGDGHIREGIGDFRWPGTRTVLVRRHRSKHDAGRILDGRTWDAYPVPAVAA